MNDTPTDRAESRLRRLLLAGGCFAAAMVLVGIIWIQLLGESPTKMRVDLQPTYLAGRLWSEGQHEAIYHSSVFLTKETAEPAWIEMFSKIEPERTRLPEGSYVYSPWYLMLVAPLTTVMTVGGFTVFWFWVNVLSAAWIGWEAMGWAGRKAVWQRSLGALLAGLLAPMIYGAWLGQNVAPCLALMMMGVRFADGGRRLQVASGLLFALAVLFKPWAILLIPMLGLARRWVPFATAAGVTLVLLAAAQSPLLPQVTRDDYRGMNETLVNLTNVAFNNISARAFLERLGDPAWGEGIRKWNSRAVDPGIRLGALLAAAAVAGLAAWPFWKARGDLRKLFAAGLALILVPLGICWTHYLIVLIPGIWMMVFGSKSIIPRVIAGGILVFLVTMPFYDAPGAMMSIFEDAPDRSQIASHPRLWAGWYLLPLVMGIGLAFTLLLAGRGAGRPCSGRSSSP